MKIDPYRSFENLEFGASTKDDCISKFGKPNDVRRNREGIDEFHYPDCIIRFDPATNTLRECTLLPPTLAEVAGINITWDKDFLRKACARDGSPKNVYGFVVLPLLGIAVTGIHDDDATQLAITAFSAGDFDALLEDAIPFDVSNMT